jgi:hypothetical protein
MWYESEIFGVIVGTLLGFLLSFVPARLELRRERSALEHALMVEVASTLQYLDERRTTYERYRSMLSKGGKLGIYVTERRLDSVYQANVGRISQLQQRRAGLYVEYYASLNEFSGRVRALSFALDRSNAGTDPLLTPEFFLKSMDKLLAAVERAIAVGKQLQTGAAT